MQMSRRRDPIVITRRSQPMAVLISVEAYKSCIETLELLAAPKALECFRRGITDLKSGRVKVLTVRD